MRTFEACGNRKGVVLLVNLPVISFDNYLPKMLCRIACLVAFVVAGVSANYSPGGPSQIDDVNDESVVAAADFAVTEMNKQSKSEYKLIRSNIIGGTMQVRPSNLVRFQVLFARLGRYRLLLALNTLCCLKLVYHSATTTTSHPLQRNARLLKG